MKIITASVILFSIFALFYCCVDTDSPEAPPVAATYTGSTTCKSCHQQQYTAFAGSDHYHAMDTALPRSVRGDFNNAWFVYFGDTTWFYRKDSGYYVRTLDDNGKHAEFKVDFTFGWRPLQQYLVKFPGGRLQTLPFCWDTRPTEQGGQRWFHLYDKELIPPGDELFWTGINQNWNTMCADCHTTDFKRNYDINSHSFNSTWHEGNVSCESCHGPASQHLSWAEKKSPGDSLKGFAVNLSGEKVSWVMNTERGIAFPEKHINIDVQIENCARCHARANRMNDHFQPGKSFLQSHIPATISTDNYYIDGQIKEEDYEYGSYLQSKMYLAGVTCNNCHDPHSMQLKAPGNLVCGTCHVPDKYDVPAHTHHQLNSTGAQCANCHMPVTTYMVVDDRRDHSIRIPRPDLSATLNTPNACNKCHKDKSTAWAAAAFKQWYGDKLPKEKTYGELMHTVAGNTPESNSALYSLLASKNYPAIVKATALEQYSQFYSTGIIDQVKGLLQVGDPNLRRNALRYMEALPQEMQVPLVSPLLYDPVLAVRTEAMNTISPLYGQLEDNTRQRFEAVMNEYIGIQRSLSDRPEGYLNQGILFALTGRSSEAEQVYLLGLQRFPKHIPLYGNLADLYRSMGQEAKCKEYLDKGLLVQPGNAPLQYALGLWCMRNDKMAEGLAAVKKAAELNTTDATFTYGYAIALHSMKRVPEAINVLEQFIKRNGNDPLIINGLAAIYQDRQQGEKAQYYLNLQRTIYGR